MDIQAEGGFAFREADGPWTQDGDGRGPLFKDPYPLSEDLFLVAHKPRGPGDGTTPNGYGLYLLDETGRVSRSTATRRSPAGCPIPCRPRPVPPVLSSSADPELAARTRRVCMVSDVYHGLEDVRARHDQVLRVLEQVPRPWAARRRWAATNTTSSTPASPRTRTWG